MSKTEQGTEVYLILKELPGGSLVKLDEKAIEGFAWKRAREILNGAGPGDIPPSPPLYVVAARRFE